MTYFGMPFGMWTLFAPSFRNQLTAVFGYGTNTAKTITKKAKPKYREIISELPEFEKDDRFFVSFFDVPIDKSLCLNDNGINQIILLFFGDHLIQFGNFMKFFFRIILFSPFPFQYLHVEIGETDTVIIQ